MQAAQLLAGYTLGGADLLRRAMGKKKPEEMAKQREIFVKGAAKTNNIPAAKANQVFDLLEKFAGYGFNKSHAAAYAIVAYQTAYLKANYPVEFLSAMMTNDMNSTDKLTIVLNEARAMGVEVLPPDVNEGQAFFWPARSANSLVRANAETANCGLSGPHSDANPLSPIGGEGQGEGARVTRGSNVNPSPQPSPLNSRGEGEAGAQRQAIRFGLAAIKGVGELAVKAVIEAREKSGRFESLSELCERVDSRSVNKKTLEALIKCGACDSLGETRAGMFANLERVMARAASNTADRVRGQSSMFGMLEESAPRKVEKTAQLPEWPQHELLAHEKELLGFYVTGHPMTPYAPLLEKYCLHNSVTAKALPPRTLTRLGGMISAVQEGFSKKNGKPYAMVTIEDLEGTVSMLCMNENYDKYRELLVQGKALLIVGEVNNDEDKPKLFPQEILPLEDAPRKYTKQVHLRLNTAHLTPETLQAARSLAEAHVGRVPLFLCLRRPGGELVFIETHEKYNVAPSQSLQQAVDDLFGEDTYYAKVDATLPERQKRAWERKPDNGGDE
jgi:DNA polymerase-3 subunit alpha